MMDFSRQIDDWYQRNKRDLPWRLTKNPYKIWISEVILQQTRVDQGLPYYERFIQTFPSVETLAQADEQQVLSLWQGLGYYSRARNLHKGARYVSNELNGIFPKTKSELLAIPGIGDYTASAIASFAFNEPVAVLDGNVFRVLSRVFDIDTPIDTSIGRKQFQELNELLLNKVDPATHNNAIMEFGALQCSPKPKCDTCPLQKNCLSFAHESISNRPIKKGKTQVKPLFIKYFIFEDNDYYYLNKRSLGGIWSNMYDFPHTETSHPMNEEELNSHIRRNNWGIIDRWSESIVHLLSHRKITAEFIHLRNFTNLPKDIVKIKKHQIGDYPLPRLIDRYLEELNS